MTELSRRMYRRAMGDMSADEVVAMMRGDYALRSVREKLMAAAPGMDELALKRKLIDALAAHREDAVRDSMRRKVNNWMNGEQVTLSKWTAIELCFILGLSLEAGEALVVSLAEEGFHWRDPEEMIFGYGLEHALSWERCLALRDEALSRMRASKDAAAPEETAFTDVVRKGLDGIDSEEALLAYIVQSQANLGSKHNRAYVRFMEMLDRLKRPETLPGMPEEGAVTTRELLEAHLFAGELSRVGEEPAEGEASFKTRMLIRRCIVSAWPDESSLSRMQHRRIDVTRKALILLYLATCDTYDFDEEHQLQLDDEGIELSRDEVFELFRDSMDDFLAECGYGGLDPRSPFDWLVLHSMYPEDVAEDEIWEAGDRLRDFLERYGEAGMDSQDGSEA